MGQDYVIFADVSADVDEAFAKENQVQFIPMSYTLGEENRHCAGMEREDVLVRFYNSQREGDLTQTSQINPVNYKENWEPYLKEGKSILYLALSSGLSGTFQSASLAAGDLLEEYEGVEIIPVDSLCATGGMGLLIEAAVANRDKGMSVSENAQWLNENRYRVNHWFLVEDLMYLKRGGRISAATALVGTTLNIKPVLKIDAEGKLINFDKKRGTKGAIKALSDLYAKSRTADSEYELENNIYIVHADAPQSADLLEKMVKETNPDASVTKMMLSPIIGAHTGPGMAAVIHWGQKR